MKKTFPIHEIICFWHHQTAIFPSAPKEFAPHEIHPDDTCFQTISETIRTIGTGFEDVMMKKRNLTD
jgi:hypothetical protein